MWPTLDIVCAASFNNRTLFHETLNTFSANAVPAHWFFHSLSVTRPGCDPFPLLSTWSRRQRRMAQLPLLLTVTQSRSKLPKHDAAPSETSCPLARRPASLMTFLEIQMQQAVHYGMPSGISEVQGREACQVTFPPGKWTQLLIRETFDGSTPLASRLAAVTRGPRVGCQPTWLSWSEQRFFYSSYMLLFVGLETQHRMSIEETNAIYIYCLG